jgi:Tol biopolymer transport system component
MKEKSRITLLIGLFILTTLSCSLTNPRTQSGQTNVPNSISTEPLEELVIEPTKSTPEKKFEDLILYQDTEGLFLFNLQTDQTELLLAGDVSESQISPNGRYLAYLEKSPDPEMWMIHNLKIIELESGQHLNTSNIPEDVNTFTWSNDSTGITFTRRNYDFCTELIDHQITGLYQFDINKNETAALHIGTDQYVFWIEDWSSDGRYLLFSQGPDCSEGRSLMYFDSQTNNVGGIPFLEASWSPNGNTLAANDLWYWEPEELPLMLYDVPNQEQMKLFFQPGYYASSPIWSPDGEWIAFTLSTIENYNPQPMVLEKETGEIKRIDLEYARPVIWNADSAQVVLTQTQENNNKDIYLFNIRSGNIELILENIEGPIIQWLR